MVWWIAAKWADLRKLLANSDARFRDLVAGLLDLGHDEGTVAALVAKHLPLRKLLSRIGQLMRANRMLSDDEISELCVKCEKYGADFRVAFRGKHQTPKLIGSRGTCRLLQSGLGQSESSVVMVGKPRPRSGKTSPSCVVTFAILAHGCLPPSAYSKPDSEPREARAKRRAA